MDRWSSGLSFLFAQKDASTQNTLLIIGLVALGIGAGVLLIGGYLIARGCYRDSLWVRTPGVIASYNHYGDEIPTTYAIVSYRDADNQEHKSEIKAPDYIVCPPLGSPVALRYDPRTPARVEFEREVGWLMTWLFFVGFFGLGLSLMGAVILVVGRSGAVR
jgi:hypothetical protein